MDGRKTVKGGKERSGGHGQQRKRETLPIKEERKGAEKIGWDMQASRASWYFRGVTARNLRLKSQTTQTEGQSTKQMLCSPHKVRVAEDEV